MSLNGQILLAAPLRDFAFNELQAVRRVAQDSHNARKEEARREWQRQRMEAEIRQAYKERKRARGGL